MMIVVTGSIDDAFTDAGLSQHVVLLVVLASPVITNVCDLKISTVLL